MSTPALRLTAQFRDNLGLAQAWMPFIKNGALFVPSAQRPALGDAAFVLVTLESTGQRYAVSGKVVWLSALSPEPGQVAGVGIQFGEDDVSRNLVSQIQALLGNMQSSLKKTATL